MFEVETGAGSATATSYASVEVALAFASDRGDTAWAAATEQEQQAALVRATEYIDGVYGERFIGKKKTRAQALEWPRTGAADEFGTLPDDEIPPQLVEATCQAAREALAADLSPSYSEIVSEVVVGPIKRVSKQTAPVRPRVARAIRPLVAPGAAGLRVSR